MVLEYFPDGTLLDLVNESRNQVQEELAANIIKQILEAVSKLHQKRIVHCDIKPANILIRKQENKIYEIVIADFGIAKVVPPGYLISNFKGTPTYMAPEVLSNNGFSFKADMFSIGSLMYNLLST